MKLTHIKSLPKEKPLDQSRVENSQTQPTYDAKSENWTQATLAEGECSHHCATTALSIQLSIQPLKWSWSVQEKRLAFFCTGLKNLYSLSNRLWESSNLTSCLNSALVHFYHLFLFIVFLQNKITTLWKWWKLNKLPASNKCPSNIIALTLKVQKFTIAQGS